MEAVLKQLAQEIEKERLNSGNAYASGSDERGRKHEYIATGLEQAYRILISEMVAN
jgi:hypothetical protein